MNFLASIRIALRALRVNKLRSSLTMLGIIIGVAAVIVMIAIGAGAQAIRIAVPFTASAATVPFIPLPIACQSWPSKRATPMASTSPYCVSLQVPRRIAYVDSIDTTALSGCSSTTRASEIMKPITFRSRQGDRFETKRASRRMMLCVS